MGLVRAISLLFPFVLFFFSAGCEQMAASSEARAEAKKDIEKLSAFARYAPVGIDILPLTEVISVGDTQQAEIKLYVSLLDQYGSQVKSPGMFRFELYEHVQRSAEPKGKRAVIWPDIDLADPAANNRYWRDFLRTYEFNLPFEQVGNQSYILEVTFLCSSGKRLSSEFTLKHVK